MEPRMFKFQSLALLSLLSLSAGILAAQPAEKLILDRGGATVSLEPYAPNIIRVTLSLDRAEALKAPGYGLVAHPQAKGWQSTHTSAADTYTSSQLVVRVDQPVERKLMDTEVDIAKFFNGSAPQTHIVFSTPSGRKLLEMTDWAQSEPNHKDGTASLNNDRRASDAPFYVVGATFAATDDEHYYGLGENQEGILDHRGHPVPCFNDYLSAGGPNTCVPFLVTNKGYGLLWDNASRTSIFPAFNEQTIWKSEVGNRVSFFVIAGEKADDLYAGYRLLSGATPLLPKAAYGYIQCKQRYSSQKELLDVAQGYRDRHLPADMLIVDWFYYTKMGQMDLDPAKWPDPDAMNRKLHEMGYETMISVWPRFEPGSRFYNELRDKGYLIHLADGTPISGQPYDRAGSDIDTTNPAAATWFWSSIHDNILARGFDSIWADETEPDLPPNGSYYWIGPGTRFYNVYPWFHTKALYDGFRRDMPGKRALILSRDGFTGIQANGAIVWSSDIYPTWDTLRRQIPTGLDFAASGISNWSNDTGGWQYLPPAHKPAHKPLLDPSDARENVGNYDDYPELYTRWFEYATFLPIMRAHGSRLTNEVWSFGREAEPILEKFLRLRYELMPYIYSQAYHTYLTGAPIMRALPLDFPNDPAVADMRDEYMFGPAFLVAPVVEQGATSRSVYLPAGSDWYNYWTGERSKGGVTLKVAAPIDQIPLFVRAGSILPIGAPVDSTHQPQAIAKVLVYPGANADFALYNDDGKSYAYENGDFKLSHLHWNDASRQLTHDGAAPWTGDDAAILKIVGK